MFSIYIYTCLYFIYINMKVFLSDGLINPRDVDWLSRTFQLDGWYTISDGKDYVSILNELTHENMPHVISIGNLSNMDASLCADLLMEHCMSNDIDPPIMFCHVTNEYEYAYINEMWSKYLELRFDPKYNNN